MSAFGLLFVCTGNVCRSPFAEILTRHLLLVRMGDRADAHFDVSSAGLHAVVDAPLHPHTRGELACRDVDNSVANRFRARQLDRSMISVPDLVLGVSPQHSSTDVQCDPTALRKAFSLREFARLVGSVDPTTLPVQPAERARSLVEHARHRRGMVPPVGPDADRIPDPIGWPRQAHRNTAMLIHQAVIIVVTAIAPPSSVASARAT
ncbi:MAG: protein-tyrosine-phosphatase [Actinomycetia bacterium]|nr:protein-tyrosine-phosphatase [Actinomycetes bacterium]